MSTFENELDSSQKKVYDKLKIIQPCLLPLYTPFQKSLMDAYSPEVFVMVCENEATYFMSDTPEEELKMIINKYHQSKSAIGARSILLGIQESVAKIKVETNLLDWHPLEGWVATNLIGQRLWGVEENAINWTKSISSIYAPKNS